jgi:tetratricopeptide (TPR) repeat protein
VLQRRWRVYAAMAVATAAGLAFAVLSGVRHDAVGFNQTEFSFYRYGLVQCAALVHYLRLALWPHPLVFDYYEWPDVHTLREVWWQALLLAVLAAGIAWAWLRRPAWALPWIAGWFILAPTSLIPNAGERIGEHRMYIPLAAVIITLVGALGWAGQRWLRGGAIPLDMRRAAAAFAAAAAAVALGWMTIDRNRVYASERTLWKDVLAKMPDSARAWASVGEADYYEAQSQRDPAAARQSYERAVESMEHALALDPQNADLHLNLGKIYHEHLRGTAEDRQRAMDHYRQALEIRSDHAEAHTNLANLLMVEGRRSEAKEQFQAALAIRPNLVNALYGLGQALAMEGDLQGAEAQYKQALAGPSLYEIDVRIMLARLYARMQRWEDSAGQYRAVLAARPTDAALHFQYGEVCNRLEKRDEAVRHFREALRLRPDFTQAQERLRELGG